MGNDNWPGYLGPKKSAHVNAKRATDWAVALFFVWLVVWAALVGGAIYVAVHFIGKYW